jgi:hypothetical protein
MKEKNKKDGLRRGRLPPYPVGIVFPIAQRCNRRLLASLSAGAACCGHASSYAPLCCQGRAIWAPKFAWLGGIVVITPIAIEVWMSWW